MMLLIFFPLLMIFSSKMLSLIVFVEYPLYERTKKLFIDSRKYVSILGNNFLISV